MLIKDFAEKFHIQADTIRYYEKENLLKPKRQANGYRDYDEDCEKQLQFIIVLKQLGFTIKEIQQLLRLKDQPLSSDCNSSTVSLFEQKITNIEEKIQFYQQALNVLQKIKDLMAEKKYEENKEIIEELILVLFRIINMRAIL